MRRSQSYGRVALQPADRGGVCFLADLAERPRFRRAPTPWRFRKRAALAEGARARRRSGRSAVQAHCWL